MHFCKSQLSSMKLCPPNISFVDIWVDHGVSECFMDTVTSSILALFLLLFGGTQLWMYKKYGTRTAYVNSSKLYYLQVFMNILLCMVVVVKYSLDATVLNYKTLFIYQIISASCLVFAITFATYLTSLERNYVLPSIPTRGHGLILLTFWTLLLIFSNLTFINLKRSDWWFSLHTYDDKVEMYLFICYYVGALTLFVLGLKAPGLSMPGNYLNLTNSGTEGSTNQNRQQGMTRSTWSNIGEKIKVLSPYLWPRKNHTVKLKVLVCFLVLMLARVINVYVPIYSKLLINSMVDKPLQFRWDFVLVFVGFKFLQGGGTGGMGLLNNVRSYLWIDVQQYTKRELDTELFRHIHSLSLRWHLSRKTGEVIRIMDRGTSSVNNILNNGLFQIVPTLADIFIAVVFFVTNFNAWYGFIVFTTMALYLAFSIVVTEWRTKFQRRMNLADNAMSTRATDSLLNFETVKYYGADEYEVKEYKECIKTYQIEEYKNLLSLVFLNSSQNLIITGGLLAGSLLCVYQVVREESLTVGDYTLFAAYILQLYVPLNWFGTYYRTLQRNFVDMENMFQLLHESTDVKDDPQASLLCVTHGVVEFKNVSFNYLPDQLLLQNISFRVPAGKTLALVGQSGSGKSTIIRLLFRFWDAESGDIFIDGQNIRNVTQASLRQAIGVVPQDTILFNNSIKFNIRYAKTSASDEEVMEAAKNADIHEKIQHFPAGYETQVGERGLKLSGGEKQRVAIARTLLKAPEIVLLDEATSALDTHTERNIQAALNKACVNRTTIIVAHRLSTITHADEIIVMYEGKIVERGRHEELLENKGTYFSMWKSQSESNNANKSSTDNPNGTRT